MQGLERRPNLTPHIRDERAANTNISNGIVSTYTVSNASVSNASVSNASVSNASVSNAGVSNAGVSNEPWRIILAFFTLNIGHWMGMSLLTISLAYRNTPATIIGALAAIHWLPLLAAPPLLPHLLRGVGVTTVYFGAIVFILLGSVGFLFTSTVTHWFLFNALIGIGFATVWVITDSWVSATASTSEHEAITGLSDALSMLAIAVGPAILFMTGVQGIAPWLLLSALPLLAMVPLVGLPNRRLRLTTPASLATIWQTAKQRRGIPLFSLLAGLFEGAVLTVLPIYGFTLHYSNTVALWMVVVIAFGSLLAQIPVGVLATKMGAIKTRNLLAFILIVISLLLLLSQGSVVMWVLLFMWGAVVAGLQLMAILDARHSSPNRNAMNNLLATISMSYIVGNMFGPLLGGFLFDVWGAPALFASMTIVLCSVLAYLFATHTSA